MIFTFTHYIQTCRLGRLIPYSVKGQYSEIVRVGKTPNQPDLDQSIIEEFQRRGNLPNKLVLFENKVHPMRTL